MEENKTNNPNYYAVIPSDVRYADIPPNAKLLYGEITALSNKEGFCWASDSYFAELYKVTRQTVNSWVSILAKHGFIIIETYMADNNVRKRKLHLECRENPTGVSEKPDRGVSGKADINNTSINNTINKDNVEIQSIYDLYISLFKKNPNIYKLTTGRKQKIKKRLSECGVELLTAAITNTSASDFHTGENDRGWKADLDFIIRSQEQVERLASMEVKQKEVRIGKRFNLITGEYERYEIK